MEKSEEKKKTIVTVLFLALLVLSVYGKAVSYNFVYYDDNRYVVENYHIHQGLSWKGIVWAFTTGYGGNWHPLTWISHMLDVQLFGLNPGWHHLVSILLHVASTLILFLVLKRMTWSLWKSAFVAALFALHPLHVESVAWIAERKDVLSGLFWMLTMWFYLLYVEKPVSHHYLWMLLFFTLGLLSKPMLVTLPLVLLLLDYWPLKRFDFTSDYKIPFRLIREKIPLFALAFLSCIFTFFAERLGGSVRSLESFPIGVRIANTLISYTAYIVKMIWPLNLAVFYPHPGASLPVWKVFAAAFFLIIVTTLVLAAIKRFPYLFVGWFWYLGTLVPVIGLVQIGEQGMADRYTYIPLIGIFLMIAWGIPQIFQKGHYRKIFSSTAGGIILFFIILSTWFQLNVWKDTLTLFQHALKVTDGNYVAYNNIGVLLARRGEVDQAIQHYLKGLKIKPDDSETNNNLGFALVMQGKLKKAIPYFEKAIEVTSRNEYAQTNLAVALAQLGRTDEAIAHFEEGLKINPYNWKTHKNIAIALASKGRLEEAALHLEKALQIRPEDKPAKIALEKIREILHRRP